MFYLRDFDLTEAFTLSGPDGEIRPLEDLKKRIILMAHEYYLGNIQMVSDRLDIGRSTLYRIKSDVEADNDLYCEQRVERLLQGIKRKYNKSFPDSLLTREFNLLQKKDNVSHFKPMDQLLGEIIDRACEHYPTVAEASRRLNIGRSTLYRRLEPASA